ncbi:MAG: DoxX family membrane protein [Silvibacterium sp.]
MKISETSHRTDVTLAYALLRFVLGVNIFMHGASRIYAGVHGFANSLLPGFQKTPLPASAVYAFGLALPYAEAILGGLLLLGLGTRFVCVLGLLLLATLTFGSSLHQDWNAAGIQLVYALIYSALLGLRQYNLFSLDAWIFRRRHGTASS